MALLGLIVKESQDVMVGGGFPSSLTLLNSNKPKASFPPFAT